MFKNTNIIWQSVMTLKNFLFINFRDGWKANFTPRDLITMSAEPLLVEPTHYTGEPNYISDTENSFVVKPEESLQEGKSSKEELWSSLIFREFQDYIFEIVLTTCTCRVNVVFFFMYMLSSHWCFVWGLLLDVIVCLILSKQKYMYLYWYQYTFKCISHYFCVFQHTPVL